MQGLTPGRSVLRRLLLLAAALLAQSVLSLAQAAPMVSLTSPGEGWLYNAPANLPLRASATAEAGTTITRVEFYANGNLIATDATTAYAYNWNGVAAGTYVLTVRAIDSTGAEATSAARSVTVSDTNQPPTVSLTSPANNATYALPADITVTASAANPERNGSVTQVEFFANGKPPRDLLQTTLPIECNPQSSSDKPIPIPSPLPIRPEINPSPVPLVPSNKPIQLDTCPFSIKIAVLWGLTFERDVERSG